MTSTFAERSTESDGSGAPALEVTGLTAGYGRSVILRDVELVVPVGQVTALLGPNGAGKSTLLRTTCGFLRPSGGQVRLFGDDVTGVPPHQRFARGLCHVPEGRGIFRSLTVRENLALQAGRKGDGAALERASAAFPILGQRMSQVAGTMSGGQQQMLAMAAAYVRNPRLVMVDEASLGLAPIVVDEIFEFLQRLTTEGSSLLLVDQMANRALDMATTAYVMRRGRIVFHGTSEKLRSEDVFSHYVGGQDLRAE